MSESAGSVHWVCCWCIATKGLRERDLDEWPEINDEEAQARHVEAEHHIAVERPGESPDETNARFAREQPEAGGPFCRCPSCRNKRARAALAGAEGEERAGGQSDGH